MLLHLHLRLSSVYFRVGGRNILEFLGVPKPIKFGNVGVMCGSCGSNWRDGLSSGCILPVILKFMESNVSLYKP